MELTQNTKTTEYTNQQAFVMYYKFDRYPRDIQRLPIKITYVSSRLKAIYFYTDEKLVAQIASRIKHIKGLTYFEKAPLFDETLNF